MKTDEEVKIAAREIQMAHLACYIGEEFTRESMKRLGFDCALTAIHQTQKDLLESANLDDDTKFEEWVFDVYFGDADLYLKHQAYMRLAFEACRNMKNLQNQKIIQEKDQKIAELESKFKAERNDVLYMDKRRDEFKDKYEQVFKDLHMFIREALSGAPATYLETIGNRLKLKHGISEE
jgi:hypothetical protein